jgi:hypothetical protein
MKITKDLIIVALATFCLTSTLFMIASTRSQPGQYDPWYDLDDDGKISILDAIDLSNVYGTSGDPTKNVNVTNPRVQVIEKDVNISVFGGHPFPLGMGTGSTDPFETEGYDRMFVSAAIIDISDYYTPRTMVSLYRLNWHWGTVNGTDMMTYTTVDSNKTAGVRVDLYDASDIPVSSENSAEFEVRASECSLSFSASTEYEHLGWVLVRVSIYLTVGTTSPPVVQNTYVTNMPSSQPEPAYQHYTHFVNTSITNGHLWTATDVNVAGYGRMFISIQIVDASYQGVPITTTIALRWIRWSAYGSWESVSGGILDATYNGTGLPVYSQQAPPEFNVKSSSCGIYFDVNSGAFSGWIGFVVDVYLRNE